MLMHLFWILEIIGDSAMNIFHYVLSIISFLTLILVAVVVFSQKELRLPKFGKKRLPTIGNFTSCIVYNIFSLALEVLLLTSYSYSLSAVRPLQL